MSIRSFKLTPSPPFAPNQNFTSEWEWNPSPPLIANFSIEIRGGGNFVQVGNGSYPNNKIVCLVPDTDITKLTGNNWTLVLKFNDIDLITLFSNITFHANSGGGSVGNAPLGASSFSLPLPSILPSSASSSSGSVNQQESSAPTSPSTPAVIAGSVIGAAAFVTLVAFLFWWRFRRSRNADSVAKKELMSDGSFTARGTNYQVVSGEASNDVLLRIANIGIEEKYIDQQPPVGQELPKPTLPVAAPMPYKPLLSGPTESTTTTANVPYNQSSQMRYVPAIAGPGGQSGPGGASPPAAPHSDPYGDSKTQEDE